MSIESAFNGDPLAVRVSSEQPVTAAVRTLTGGDVAYAESGKQLSDSAVSVPKASSVATRLPAGARYVRLVAQGADAVAGFTVSDPAGIATGGVLPSIGSVLQPVVRPAW